MILKQLNESVEVDEILKQPYFRYFPNMRLYHGTPNKFSEITFLPFKLRTSPTNTDKRVHDIVNELTLDEFGLPLRSLLFCYRYDETMYGHSYMIVPKGEFRLFHNPNIHDMTIDLGVDVFVDHDAPDTIPDKLYPYIGENEYTEFFVDKIMENVDIMDVDIHVVIEAMNDMVDEFDDDGEDFEKVFHFINSHKEDILMKIGESVNEMLRDIAHEYVSGIEEITSEESGFEDDRSEVMLYAPNGFYVIPDEYFERFDK